MDINTIGPILNIIIAVLALISIGLAAFIYLNKNKKNSGKKQEENKTEEVSSKYQPGLTRESIHKFLDFDEVKDNMIIRKDRKQYVMVIQCQGVNYDLLSEEEKIGVEEGFVQFLNILRYPIQLYIQTRSLNLRSIIDEYRNRVKEAEVELEQIKIKLRDARNEKE